MDFRKLKCMTPKWVKITTSNLIITGSSFFLNIKPDAY